MFVQVCECLPVSVCGVRACVRACVRECVRTLNTKLKLPHVMFKIYIHSNNTTK